MKGEYQLNEEQFAQEFLMLQSCKQIFPSELISLVYWEELKNLEHLSETLKECRNRQWFKDFNKSIPRFPETIEIKEVNQEIVKKKNYVPLKILPENAASVSSYMKGKPKGYARIMSLFCTDLMSAMDINCSQIWDFIEENDIEIPKNYLEVRKNPLEVIEIAKKIGIDFQKLNRIKKKGNITHSLIWD